MVDDNVMIRLVIAAFLRDCGYRVVEAASADEAITVLSSEVEVDVVLSDIEMGAASLDGFALNRWIREDRSGLPVLLAGTPARASEAAADLCRDGPNLERPYQPQLVLDRIRRLLGDRASPARRPGSIMSRLAGAGGLAPNP